MLPLTDRENNEKKKNPVWGGQRNGGKSGLYYELARRPQACYFLLLGLFSHLQNVMFVLDLA